VLAIAHRLSTIARMDRLIVLEGGCIVEQGPHDALLRQDGHYAALWRRQSGGFLADEPDDDAAHDGVHDGADGGLPDGPLAARRA
jgi:ATP-binding cassette subfamily B multidrug efflux pump